MRDVDPCGFPMPRSVVFSLFLSSQHNSLKIYLHDVCPRYGSMEKLKKKKTQKASLSFPAGQLKALKNSKRSNSCLKGWWCRNIAWPKNICISSCAFTCEIQTIKSWGKKSSQLAATRAIQALKGKLLSLNVFSTFRGSWQGDCIMIYIYIILYHSCSPCSPEARPGLPGKPLRSSPFLTVGEQMKSKSKFLK